MRKQFIFGLFILVLFLSGCSQGAVSAVEDVYRASLDGDREKVAQLFSQFDGYDSYYLDEVMDDISWSVLDIGGIENMNLKEVKRKELKPEAIEELDDMYGENWELVATQLDEDDFFFWVLKKVSGSYFIVDAEDFDLEDLEEMLK
ncbi:hypothetical protein [Oceanobacillus polygoni]|uniref:Uncharacterized protein n=1 Tax=Oceanobacillus polygoni TaxID=1235259 RepID=A0A9X0YU30_9BACI|nr:hypothetical protein [Oceanobacillus polygoni]MBP2077041.1 hypothetical protein [Oceanobacillus polygoni]